MGPSTCSRKIRDDGLYAAAPLRVLVPPPTTPKPAPATALASPLALKMDFKEAWLLSRVSFDTPRAFRRSLVNTMRT